MTLSKYYWQPWSPYLLVGIFVLVAGIANALCLIFITPKIAPIVGLFISSIGNFLAIGMKIKRTEHGGYLKEVFHKSSQILVTAGLITLLSGGVILFYCRIFAGAVCNYEPFLIASFPGLLMVSLFMVNSLGVAVFNTLVRKRN